MNVVPIDQRSQTISGTSVYMPTHPEQQHTQRTHTVPTNANMIPIPKETLPSSLPPRSAVYHHPLHQNHHPSFQSHSWVAQVQPMINNSYSLNQTSYDKMTPIIPSQQQNSQHSQNIYTYQNQYLVHSGSIMANSFNTNSFETSYTKGPGPNHIVLADFGQALLRPDIDHRLFESEYSASYQQRQMMHSQIYQFNAPQPTTPSRQYIQKVATAGPENISSSSSSFISKDSHVALNSSDLSDRAQYSMYYQQQQHVSYSAPVYASTLPILRELEPLPTEIPMSPEVNTMNDLNKSIKKVSSLNSIKSRTDSDSSFNNLGDENANIEGTDVEPFFIADDFSDD